MRLSRKQIKIQGFDADWAEPTFRIVRLLVIAIQRGGGLSVFAGVIFSPGSPGFISKMMAGYSPTRRRAYKVGGRVKTGEVTGGVEHVRVQVTHLRSLRNEEIIIPNSVVVNSSVVNFSSMASERGLILHNTAGIGYPENGLGVVPHRTDTSLTGKAPRDERRSTCEDR